jgi:hypothetical protein
MRRAQSPQSLAMALRGSRAMAGRLSRPSWATQWMSRWIGAASVYIADASSDRIRKVDAGGRISTIAGSAIRGFSGDGGPATRAQLASPNAVAVDRDGNVTVRHVPAFGVKVCCPPASLGAGPLRVPPARSATRGASGTTFPVSDRLTGYAPGSTR